LLKVLALQVIAATLGTLSIGGADWLYYHGRIGQPLHSFWVSSSSTAICLPLLTYMDHHHIPRRWGDQLDIGRYIRGGDVSLDVPQLAEDT
jgi:hypothetical protein